MFSIKNSFPKHIFPGFQKDFFSTGNNGGNGAFGFGELVVESRLPAEHVRLRIPPRRKHVSRNHGEKRMRLRNATLIVLRAMCLNFICNDASC